MNHNNILPLVTITLTPFKDVGVKVGSLKPVNSDQEWKPNFWELNSLMVKNKEVWNGNL